MGQNFYTPDSLRAAEFLPDQRAYAGWLYYESLLQLVKYRRTDEPTVGDGPSAVLLTPTRLVALEADIGFTGPLSFARDVQRRWHEQWGFTPINGWDHQVPGRAGLVISASSSHRLGGLASRRGFGGDLVIRYGGVAGNIFDHVSAGTTIRGGLRLTPDFGQTYITPTIRTPSRVTAAPSSAPGVRAPVISPSTAPLRQPAVHSWEVYLFVRGDGRAVAYNYLLTGNPAHTYEKRRLVGDFAAGLGVRREWVRISGQKVWRSAEFEPLDRTHRFWAVAITVAPE